MSAALRTRGGAAARSAADSPLMRQYARVKQDHADAFLFFRLGDFYEMFFDDAVRGAQLLGLTLTSRNRQDPDPIPMCGIPWHQRDGYLARLLRLGHRVAVCDQIEEPAPGKALVARAVTEVLTPGSVTGEAFLDPAANNFLAALWPDPERLGVCLADASTGEVRLAEPAWEEAGPWLARLRVAEWVVPHADGAGEPDARLEAALAGLAGTRSGVPAERFLAGPDPGDRWGDLVVAPFEHLTVALTAARGALDYLDRMNGGLARHVRRVEHWREDDAMGYDQATARHLELFEPQPGGEPRHTLWHHVNRTLTPLGARRLRAWLERPLASAAAIAERLDRVAAWKEAGDGRAALRDALRGFPDLERLAARVACGKATPRDLGALREALGRLPDVRAVAAFGSEAMARDDGPLAGAPELERRLLRALVDDPPMTTREAGIIRPGHDDVRDALDQLAHSGKRWIAELEAAERARTGIASLKVGYNRVFGYYLEVTRPHLDKVPPDFERRQTLTTAERFVTPALKAKEGEVLSAQERLVAREHELFVALRDEAARHVPALQAAADALARLDAEAALAEHAAAHAWVRPEIDDSDALAIDAGRHPVVERLLPQGAFVPNDCRMDTTARQILLVTGPNMGGKSTYLRQVALVVLLAQAGSFVPAARARVGLVDRLFTRVGAADRLGAGQSTFMVEMQETADILRSATSRSLVLLDEVGRGTATYDGIAIAWAVTERLHAASGPRPRTVFATHYHELTELAERLPRLVNVHAAVREWQEQVVFLHRIVDGAADRSYGIHVARLAGLPEPVIARAREVLAELERERTAEHLGLARRAERARPAPPSLFDTPAEHPLAAELARVDPERMTPLEALSRIAEWKRRWGGA